MIIRFFLVWTAVSLSLSLSGAALKLDALTVGTTTYSNVSVLGANLTDLYFTHANGIANVKLKYLNADLQKRFDYDPKVASEAEKRQVENDRLYQSRIASDIVARVTQAAAVAIEKTNVTSSVSLADPLNDKSPLGKAGPALEVEQWLTDQPSLEGKYVLVALWAPWSMPSRASIPDLNELQKKLRDKLVVVGISTDSAAATQELKEPKLEFPSAADATGRVSAALGATSVPFAALMDPEGVVLYTGHPAVLTEKKVRALLGQLSP